MSDKKYNFSAFDKESKPSDYNFSSFKSPDSISKLESLLRGSKQGLTFGFGDEITGAGESALGSLGLVPDKTYEQARDEARAFDEAAQKENTLSYGTGQVVGGVAGSFLPAGAILNAGKGIAGAAAVGAGLGGLAAAGDSKAGVADLNLYKDIGQGALVGGVTGGAIAGVGKGITSALGEKGMQVMREAATGNSLAGKAKGILDQESQKAEIKNLSDILQGRASVTGKAVSEAKNVKLLDDAKPLGDFLSKYADDIQKEFGPSMNDSISSLRNAAANDINLTPAKLQDLIAAVENNVKGAKLVGSGKRIVSDLESGIESLIPKTSEMTGPLNAAHVETSTALDKFKKVAEGGEGAFSSDQTAALDKASAIANTFKNANKDATGAAANSVRDLEKVMPNPEELDKIKKLGQDVFLNKEMLDESINPLNIATKIVGLNPNVKLPVLKTANFLGNVSNFSNKGVDTAKKVADKLGANTALGKKVTDILALEPTARDRALFTLSQQPWFRSVSGPDENNK